MNKKDLVERIAEKSELTKKAITEVVDLTVSTMQDAIVKGEEIKLLGLLSCSTVDVAKRVGRNPHTGAEMILPAHKKVKLKISKELAKKAKENLN